LISASCAGSVVGPRHFERRLAPCERPLDKACDAAALAAPGLGNIYVVEALHRARRSPKRRASTLVTGNAAQRPALYDLVDAIRSVLKEAIRRQARTENGNPFRIYAREGERCPGRGCGGTIRRITQAGRSTYYCPVCQP
jgi:formamidopyrimidine-DNA glycosylase